MMERLIVRGFDLHCHVDLFPDPRALIAMCQKNQIVTLAVTTTPMAWKQNRLWAAGNRYVHAATGLHPELVGTPHGDIVLLERTVEASPFIGEIGIDGSMPHRRNWARQKYVFSRALTAAQRMGGRVASVHSRRAAADVLRCIEEHTTSERVLPILHWFSDSAALAKRAVGLGCYFSVNPRMLDSDHGMELIRNLPSDRLLTETDAPFTMVTNRKTNPHDIVRAVERIAIVRGVSLPEMKETLATNARKVFAFAGLDMFFEIDRS